MASQERKPNIIRRYPQLSIATGLIFAVIGLGIYRLDQAGINPFQEPSNSHSSVPLFPGTALPEQNPNRDITPGCSVIRDGGSVVQAFNDLQAQYYPGQTFARIRKSSFGEEKQIFKADSPKTIDDQGVIVMLGDQICPQNPPTYESSHKDSDSQLPNNCVNVKLNDTLSSIFANMQAPDGYKDQIIINGIDYSVATSTDFNKLPQIIYPDDIVCIQ